MSTSCICYPVCITSDINVLLWLGDRAAVEHNANIENGNEFEGNVDDIGSCPLHQDGFLIGMDTCGSYGNLV